MKSDDAVGRRAYFDTLYDGNPDPWRYDDCDYEIAKRADTLSFLRAHYARGCEIGCSNGVLTRALATRCDRVVGIDISQKAAALARDRLADCDSVEIRVMHLPHDEPDGVFDLLVLSEVLYFLAADELAQMAALAARIVVLQGDVMIVSYDGETRTDLSGRQATDLFCQAAERDFAIIAAEQRPEFHVRLLRRRNEP
jgi:predicted TPR repeat methyltransferase